MKHLYVTIYLILWGPLAGVTGCESSTKNDTDAAMNDALADDPGFQDSRPFPPYVCTFVPQTKATSPNG